MGKTVERYTEDIEVEHRRSAMASDEARNADILRTFGTINLGEL